MASLFASAFFTEMLLPFLLIFVVVFAILQKSKILGEGKAQIDALVSLVIGLITIAFAYQTGVIVNMMAWLAVGVAVILVFLLLYGFVAGDISDISTGLKITFGILAGLFTIGVVVYVTGLWPMIQGWFGSANQDIWMSVVMLVIIGAAIAVAVTSKTSGSSDS